ncbi:putative poly-beta-1,6-N-acetyl-D-glucosamine export protein [Desulfovibrionales bacterium]
MPTITSYTSIQSGTVDPPTNTKRLVWMDILNLVAILGVVTIHTTGYMAALSLTDTENWWAATIANCAGRIGVPLFLMCSGAILLTERQIPSASAFYRRRLPKLLIPLLGWSIIFYLVYSRLSTDFAYGWWSWARHVTEGTLVPHFWYSYMLVQVYLAAPFLLALRHQLGETGMWLLVALCFGLNALNPYCLIAEFQFHFGYAIFTVYVGYFILGTLLVRQEVRLPNWLLAGVAVTGISMAVWGSWWLNHIKAPDTSLFQRYEALHLLAASSAVFLLARRLGPRLPSRLGSWLTRLTANTYGVYFCHVLVCDLLARQRLSTYILAEAWHNPWTGILASTALVYGLSLLLVLLIQRVPLLRRLVL